MSATNTVQGVVARPVQLGEAFRLMRTLLANPDETSLVFDIIRALTGHSFERLFQRVMADPVGRRVLDERRDILAVLGNLDRLRSLPDGTLGREYARFIEREQISADGLVDASRHEEDDRDFLDERARVLSMRLRDIHDLWHVVTGYQRDLYGEHALLAFSYAQTLNHGVGFIVLMALLKRMGEGEKHVGRIVWRGWREGRRAASLVAADWEALLELPLAEVRRRLNVEPAPDYTPRFSAAAAALH